MWVSLRSPADAAFLDLKITLRQISPRVFYWTFKERLRLCSVWGHVIRGEIWGTCDPTPILRSSHNTDDSQRLVRARHSNVKGGFSSNRWKEQLVKVPQKSSVRMTKLECCNASNNFETNFCCTTSTFQLALRSHPAKVDHKMPLTRHTHRGDKTKPGYRMTDYWAKYAILGISWHVSYKTSFEFLDGVTCTYSGRPHPDHYD